MGRKQFETNKTKEKSETTKTLYGRKKWGKIGMWPGEIKMSVFLAEGLVGMCFRKGRKKGVRRAGSALQFGE